MSSLEGSAQKQAQDRSNLITRSITALVLGPLVLLIAYLGGIPFLITGLLLAVLTLMEFYALGRTHNQQGHLAIGLPVVVVMVLLLTAHETSLIQGLLLDAALIFIAALLSLALEAYRGWQQGWRGRVAITAFGLIYAGLPPAFMIRIRALPDGLLWIYLIFALTWGTDTLAYMGGRLWGKRMLAPRISPKKTIEGALVGVVGGFLIGLIVVLLAGKFTPFLMLILLLAPPVAVIGDLFESGLKRHFQIGDSHVTGLNIIPGHGGVMDRTDALIWVVTLFYAYFLLTGAAA
ncbi:MAG: phosphatidate cytidylyltransferase [Anaerolineae bacterium]|nr:phosphatidate cytidylyltransferase [Anaerolineae bacterium]